MLHSAPLGHALQENHNRKLNGLEQISFPKFVLSSIVGDDDAKAGKYNLYQAPAEESKVDSATQDLVSLCLVAHESPEWVSKNMFREAFRILKPGGSFTMLDLDKENLENLLENPFVAAVYKQTEPYMSEFLNLDPRSALEEIGFEVTAVDQASRSHRVYVARKPVTA